MYREWERGLYRCWCRMIVRSEAQYQTPGGVSPDLDRRGSGLYCVDAVATTITGRSTASQSATPG